MRIAVLTIGEDHGTGSGVPRAFLRLAGAMLVQHQVSVARKLDCQRVICVASNPAREIMALQHQAEAAGMQFHLVREGPDLSRLVTPQDEVLALDEGLFVDPAEASAILEPGQAVLVQPVESGVADGFERIDLNHASAGMLLVPGALAEELRALPPDCDVVSSLTRLALQRGIAMREVPIQARAGFRWKMIRGESDALSVEHDWLRQRIGANHGGSPGFALARMVVATFGSSLLNAGSGGRTMTIASAVTLGLALGAGRLGSLVLGFLILGAAWVLAQTAGLLREIESGGERKGGAGLASGDLLKWTGDGVLVVLAAWGSDRGSSAYPLDSIFAPVMLVLLLRVVSEDVGPGASGWLRDRLVLSLALAVMAAFGVIASATQIGALLLVVGAVVIRAGDRG